jgi:hypothetical protein
LFGSFRETLDYEKRDSCRTPERRRKLSFGATPAKAGGDPEIRMIIEFWISASAGMTERATLERASIKDFSERSRRRNFYLRPGIKRWRCESIIL